MKKPKTVIEAAAAASASMGYEFRKVTKDRDGTVTKIGEWQSPLVWVVSPATVPTQMLDKGD